MEHFVILEVVGLKIRIESENLYKFVENCKKQLTTGL